MRAEHHQVPARIRSHTSPQLSLRCVPTQAIAERCPATEVAGRVATSSRMTAERLLEPRARRYVWPYARGTVLLTFAKPRPEAARLGSGRVAGRRPEAPRRSNAACRRVASERGEVQLQAKPSPSAKLELGAVDSPLEREADRIAAQVVRAARGGKPLQHASGSVQRACASCDEERDKLLQRAAVSGSTSTREATREAPAAVEEGLASPSHGVGEPARSLLEQWLGWDLGGLRLHDGPRAAASAARIGARAYTLGRDIAFGTGELAPQTSTGLQLLGLDCRG